MSLCVEQLVKPPIHPVVGGVEDGEGMQKEEKREKGRVGGGRGESKRRERDREREGGRKKVLFKHY